MTAAGIPRRPGQVRVADVRLQSHRPELPPKRRPVILIRPTLDGWRVVALTTLRTYHDGRPREELYDPQTAGAHDASFLWGRVAVVPEIGVERLIGRLSRRDADLVIETTSGLSLDDIEVFWEAIQRSA